MKYRVVVQITAVVAVLIITLAIANNTFDLYKTTRDFLGMPYLQLQAESTPFMPKTKCKLEKICPSDSFAVRISSGAANVVGPTICFEGQNIMSHVNNNVGPGLNIVVINGETGAVDKFGYLNTKEGRQEDILAYLKGIQQGKIVLLASFDDVIPKMTDEMRDILAGMGSALIKTLKSKDNWVFAGRVGAAEKNPFEQMTVNDEKTNLYDGWPEVVEISGCFPKNTKNTKNTENTVNQ